MRSSGERTHISISIYIYRDRRRFEPDVILRNDHMIIALRATTLVFNYPVKECKQATRVRAQRVSMASFKGVIDKDGRQYSLIPLVECKEALEYTIPSFSVITR